jgi:hypothetical protein
MWELMKNAVAFANPNKKRRAIYVVFCLSSLMALLIVPHHARADVIHISKGRVINGGSGLVVADPASISKARIQGSYFLDAFATAGPPPDAEDKKTGRKFNTLPKEGAAETHSTKLVSDFAGNLSGTTLSEARAVHNFHNFETDGVGNSARGSLAQVTSSTRGAPQGGALFKVDDPMEIPWEGNESDTLQLSFELLDGFSIGALGDAEARYHYDAGTGLLGLTSLFDLDILVTGDGLPIINFHSNPLLAISDAIVQESIRSTLLAGLDPIEHTYTVGTALAFLTVSLSGIPFGETLSISDHQMGAVTVPEPSSLSLVALGIAMLSFGYLYALRRSDWNVPRGERRQPLASPDQ